MNYKEVKNPVLLKGRAQIALERSRAWGETLRQLNVALEERMDLKERRITHLEQTIASLQGELEGLMKELATARRILVCGLTPEQQAITVAAGDG